MSLFCTMYFVQSPCFVVTSRFVFFYHCRFVRCCVDALFIFFCCMAVFSVCVCVAFNLFASIPLRSSLWLLFRNRRPHAKFIPNALHSFENSKCDLNQEFVGNMRFIVRRKSMNADNNWSSRWESIIGMDGEWRPTTPLRSEMGIRDDVKMNNNGEEKKHRRSNSIQQQQQQ